MKTRTFQEHNYRAIYHNGKTMRIALDPSKPIGELGFPEFMDVKITSHCEGGCGYCYQSSVQSAQRHTGLVKRFTEFFSGFSVNQLPFQLAFGGGEPTSHPEFSDLMRASNALGMVPNYTTNGMWALSSKRADVLSATVEHCGGVAVSTHPHLEKHWRSATDALLSESVHTNLHIIIGNRSSIDKFSEIYREYTGRVKYFVLLPLSASGRSTEEFSDWDYLSASINGSPSDIAFGANFHPYLSRDHGRFNVSIYEPESMSAYLDLETMKVYRSSFSSEERLIPIGKRAA
jgi:hypothetical protein